MRPPLPCSDLTTMLPNSSGVLSRPWMSTVNWKSWPLGAGGAPTWPAVTGWLCSWMVWLDLRRRQPVGVELLRIEPDAHGILADAQHLRVADARQARQLVDQVDGGVVRHVEAVEGVVRRGQRHDLQDRGRLLLHGHALRLDGRAAARPAPRSPCSAPAPGRNRGWCRWRRSR